jgi:hypothetical protein
MPSGCANSTSEPACSGTDTQTKAWASSAGTNEPADSTTDGLANTNNLYNSNPPTNPASDYCYDLTKYGYSNWYLPSVTELQTLRSQYGNIGGFQQLSYYWSSTEYQLSAQYGYQVYFATGASSYYYKSNSLYYRCIRQYNSIKFGQRQ